MLLTITKYFFITLCIFYFYRKLLSIPSRKGILITDISCSLLLTLVVQVLKPYIGMLELSTLVLLSALVLMFYYQIPFKTSLLTTTLSYIFSIFSTTIALYLTIPIKIGFFLLSFEGESSNFISYLIIGFIQLLLARIPFRFKRLKNGMPFLQYDSLQNFGFLVSILFLVCHSIQKNASSNNTQLFIFIVQFFLGLSIIVLFCWWEKQLKTIYLKKLKERELESLKQEISILQEEITKLKQNNNELSKLIHKDNKLIPAMEYTVTTLYHSATFPDNDTKEQAKELLTQLKFISDERKGILTTYENTYIPTAHTGVLSVDAICQYMKQCAQNQNIDFQFSFPDSVKYFTDHILPEDKLTTLIADLTENAIISTKECNTQNVLLCMGIEDNVYSLSIYDSGKRFERGPLLHLGINRFTTHPTEGGSGIGLMTTLEILKNCKASFVMNECIDNPTYTKVVSICFDNLGQIRVNTRRPEILDLSKERTDILFLSNP